MASICISTFDTFDKPIRVCCGSAYAESWQAIRVEIGDGSISLSREEAAQLAADLLNAAEAVPADLTEQAA